MATPVVRNRAESVLREKKHLAVPSVGWLAGRGGSSASVFRQMSVKSLLLFRQNLGEGCRNIEKASLIKRGLFVF